MHSPLFEERNRLYTLWLSTGLEMDTKKFAEARSVARRTARESKNAWFQRMAICMYVCVYVCMYVPS